MSTPPKSPPLVGIPADYRTLGGEAYDLAAESYILAVVEAMQALPVIVPALGDRLDIEGLLGRIDGLLVTGSQSNVAPSRYNGPEDDPGTMHDTRRDAGNLALIPAAVAAGVPMLAICRGFQEMNVAYGGSLHQKIHELPGRMDHRAVQSSDIDTIFGLRHPVRLAEKGMLHALLGAETAIVNSVHSQGVDRIGKGLSVEATAEDGTIEALRVDGAKDFALGVQWHPEHRATENPVSRAIFGAFTEAVNRRHRRQAA